MCALIDKDITTLMDLIFDYNNVYLDTKSDYNLNTTNEK